MLRDGRQDRGPETQRLRQRLSTKQFELCTDIHIIQLTEPKDQLRIVLAVCRTQLQCIQVDW